MLDAAPISLYFDIEEGQSPDLEVIARASLAWNDLIKEIIAVVDPSAEVRVEFLSGTVGSRSINSVVKAVWKVAVEHPWTSGPLAAIAGVFLLALPTHLADDTVDYVLEEVFGHQDDQLSDDDVTRVAKAVADMERNKCAVELRREIYRQAERDSTITGIGSTPKVGQKPKVIVPRSEFRQRSGGGEITEQLIEQRTIWKRDYPVTIVRSYSRAEERRWRFEHDGAEFSATMRDPDFLAEIKGGHTGIEIGEGVEIRIDLRIKEELVDGLWNVKEQDVMKVIHPSGDRQPLMEFAANEPDKSDE